MSKVKSITLKSWVGDYYGLGVFCQKANLIDHALMSMVKLRSNTEHRRLFMIGIKDADDCLLSDIAYEVSMLRSKNPEAFDSFIRERCGRDFLNELREAVSDAHDWETPKMKQEIRDVFCGIHEDDEAVA